MCESVGPRMTQRAQTDHHIVGTAETARSAGDTNFHSFKLDFPSSERNSPLRDGFN